MKLRMPSERTRAYIYSVLVTGVPLLAVAGVVTASTGALVVAFAGAVLGLGLARANTSAKR